MQARLEIGPTDKTFASGLLLDLLAALRQVSRGELIALTSTAPSVADDLERWARLTGNSVVGSSAVGGGTRWLIRAGEAPAMGDDERPVGTRLWLYTNFDCNLECDYCCVRSSPRAPRRALGLETIRRIAREAAPLGVREIFVTGGEPMLLGDIVEILRACADAAPTTMLTNGLLLKGALLESMRALPRDRVTLQISLDSPTPPLHDLHRGAGTWARAWRGIEAARAAGFRVRLAATVSSEADERAFHEFLDRERVAKEDRVVRRVALRGLASEGVPITRADLVPEVTITAEGVYWHPVGAEDADLLVSREIFPLADAFEAVREALRRERALHSEMASIFHCA
jgi:pyruvate-formate lyase-activating enzyme/TusA-related sulfurtransferase